MKIYKVLDRDPVPENQTRENVICKMHKILESKNVLFTTHNRKTACMWKCRRINLVLVLRVICRNELVRGMSE